MKTNKQISRKVGVSEHTVRDRIKKMKQKGIIKGYLMVRVWEKYPAEQVPLMVTLGLSGNETGIKTVLQKLDSSSVFVLSIYKVYGLYSYLVQFRIGSMMELEKLMKKLPSKGVVIIDYYVLFDQVYPNWAESVVRYWKNRKVG